MTLEEYGALTLEEYGALIERTGELADRLAAIEAAGDPRVPHEVALAIIGGEHPVRAFRNHQELTLRELSGRSGVALSYLSETEHGRKPGSVAALTRIAAAPGSTIDALAIDEQRNQADRFAPAALPDGCAEPRQPVSES